MFALLHNLYKYVRSKAVRRVCLVVLGVDNAGKTTLINTLQGQTDKEVAPTFGFSTVSTTSRALGLGGWHVSLQVFDLGGSKNIRKVWKSYLAEVHGAVFVVDSADSKRFAECRAVLTDTLSHAAMEGKPVLVFANKQDLQGAASAAELAVQLGLAELMRTPYHVTACCARPEPGTSPDPRLRDGLGWLLGEVRTVFVELDARVQRDTAAAREEEAQRKRDRDERAQKAKEARLREQQEAQAAAASAAAPPATVDAAAAAAVSTQHQIIDVKGDVKGHEAEMQGDDGPVTAKPGLLLIGGSGRATPVLSATLGPELPSLPERTGLITPRASHPHPFPPASDSQHSSSRRQPSGSRVVPLVT